MKNNQGFDNLAAIYDAMGAVVFGGALSKAPLSFLPEVRPNALILIVGGGTGKVLSPLMNAYPRATIHYYEPSKKMLMKAMGRLPPTSYPIHFIQKPIAGLRSHPEEFDLIYTPFVLDVFTTTELDESIHILLQILKPRGHWIHTDFYLSGNSPQWQHALSKIMHLFFQLTVKMESRGLKDFQELFAKYPLELQARTTRYRGMIETLWYTKL